MEKPGGLLENTSMKMYEISSRAGYENAAYFSAAFKRYYGKSPLSSRAGSRGGRQRKTGRRLAGTQKGGKCCMAEGNGLKNLRLPARTFLPQKAFTAFRAPGNADGYGPG